MITDTESPTRICGPPLLWGWGWGWALRLSRDGRGQPQRGSGVNGKHYSWGHHILFRMTFTLDRVSTGWSGHGWRWWGPGQQECHPASLSLCAQEVSQAVQVQPGSVTSG